MRNLLLTLRYDGSRYHGWQIQPNGDTVQQRLSDAFCKISGKNENIIGCSRTDAGVHANMFCCNVRTDCTVEAEKIPDALNFYLPSDIAVYGCTETDYDFHARYDCKGKEYVYLIYNGRYRNPFYENKALFYPYEIDASMLDSEAKSFIGKHDFSAFCSACSEVNDKVREIYNFSVQRKDDIIEMKVSGNGFLYNMVRIMAGTLLDIQQGKIDKGKIPLIIESLDRNNAGPTVNGCGLYLNKVFY
ncbi:MAG: tRNA pseudouridine(38-40) synthase TruA [Candidatus Fimenecus sp.]